MLIYSVLQEMDIQAEKLYLIEQLARLEDVKIIQQIKELLNSHQDFIVGYKSAGEAITNSELIERAKISNIAIKEGRVSSIDDMEKESEKW